MGRLSFVCTTCSEHFTRKYSANRHNHNLHNGAAEIVRFIDYIAGRSSGQYPSTLHPSWYKRRNIGSRTVTDSVGNTFQPRYLPQQATSLYSASPMYPPRQIMGDPNNRTGLSQDNTVKIQELKRLAYKHSQYQNYDPDVIVEWAVQGASNGDTKFLDAKLEQLSIMDRSLSGRPGTFTVF
jgi:hypothetical protein